MFRPVCAAALISATLLSGCSGQKTLDAEQLKSSATEIMSLASEGELLVTAVTQKRAPANYTKGHPESLRQQAEDVARELTKGQSDARVQRQFDGLHDAATRLMQSLNALPATSDDPRWQQSRAELENIRREADEIRRTL